MSKAVLLIFLIFLAVNCGLTPISSMTAQIPPLFKTPQDGFHVRTLENSTRKSHHRCIVQFQFERQVVFSMTICSEQVFVLRVP